MQISRQTYKQVGRLKARHTIRRKKTDKYVEDGQKDRGKTSKITKNRYILISPHVKGTYKIGLEALSSIPRYAFPLLDVYKVSLNGSIGSYSVNRVAFMALGRLSTSVMR